jgi:hypothetical protein
MGEQYVRWPLRGLCVRWTQYIVQLESDGACCAIGSGGGWGRWIGAGRSSWGEKRWKWDWQWNAGEQWDVAAGRIPRWCHIWAGGVLAHLSRMSNGKNCLYTKLNTVYIHKWFDVESSRDSTSPSHAQSLACTTPATKPSERAFTTNNSSETSSTSLIIRVAPQVTAAPPRSLLPSSIYIKVSSPAPQLSYHTAFINFAPQPHLTTFSNNERKHNRHHHAYQHAQHRQRLHER